MAMATTTYEKVINDTNTLKFIRLAKSDDILSENEYFALMVIESNKPYNSPYVKGIDVKHHVALVGIEQTSRSNGKGYYISTSFNKRKNTSRGQTVIVEVLPQNINDCCILTY